MLGWKKWQDRSNDFFHGRPNPPSGDAAALSKTKPVRRLVLTCAMETDVIVAELGEAGAQAGQDDVWCVAIRTQVAKDDAAEGGVGNFTDQLGDLGVRKVAVA